MPPARTETAAGPSAASWATHWDKLHGFGPVVGLVLLCIAGTLLNGEFATVDNAMNVLTRTAFIGIIAVGMCFVIVSGGIDLSVGSMAALIAGCVILLMNALGSKGWPPAAIVALGMAFAVGLGAAFGLAHGLLITRGRIEPFIVTLGTLGIFRAFLTWFADGGAITLDNTLADAYSPVYYASGLGVPVPVWVFALVALAGAAILNRTAFGRYVQAIGSNEQVARYAAVNVDAVKVRTYMLLGICVGIATLLYVPRLGSASPTTGLLWELEAIAAVIVGGTALRGGAVQHRRHGGGRGAALGHQQHPQPHQHHQRVPQCRRAGAGDHRGGVHAATAPVRRAFSSLTQPLQGDDS
jgi:ribose transport system permease protein